jgi:hypothetical protein
LRTAWSDEDGVTAVLDDLHQVAALAGVSVIVAPVVEDQQV